MDRVSWRRRRAIAATLVLSIAALGCDAAQPSMQPSAVPGGVATASAGTPYWPVARSAASMAWDPTRELILLFGGDTDTGPTNALDAWDGEAWAPLAADGPAPRNDAVLVADPDRGVVVLFGGRTGTTSFTDTWEWDGDRWAEKDVEGPPARVHAVAAYDHDEKRVLLYGGVTGETTLTDTWSWDGTAWTLVDEAGIPDRAPDGMAWDSTLDRLLVLGVDLAAESDDGTYQSELWGWNGGGWELVAAGGPGFSPLQPFIEGPRHPWLIDGGVVQGRFSTHEWTGSEWEVVETDLPRVRNGHVAAFDASRHQLIVFGGFRGEETLGDTWRLDGGVWREASP